MDTKDRERGRQRERSAAVLGSSVARRIPNLMNLGRRKSSRKKNIYIYISFLVQKKKGIVLRFERIIFLRTLNTDGSSPFRSRTRENIFKDSIRRARMKGGKVWEVWWYDKSFRFQPMGIIDHNGGPTIPENRLVYVKKKKKKEERKRNPDWSTWLIHVHDSLDEERDETEEKKKKERKEGRNKTWRESNVSCFLFVRVRDTGRNWLQLPYRVAANIFLFFFFSLFNNELRTISPHDTEKKEEWTGMKRNFFQQSGINFSEIPVPSDHHPWKSSAIILSKIAPLPLKRKGGRGMTTLFLRDKHPPCEKIYIPRNRVDS